MRPKPEVGLKPDKDVTEFITALIDSLIMWELLVFLWNNPGITDRADGIAGRLGRRSEDLRSPLESLVKNHVLDKWGDEADPVYVFRPSAKLTKALEKFMVFNNDKEGKLWIWTRLLQKGLR